jgi:hypothetical protein
LTKRQGTKIDCFKMTYSFRTFIPSISALFIFISFSCSSLNFIHFDTKAWTILQISQHVLSRCLLYNNQNLWQLENYFDKPKSKYDNKGFETITTSEHRYRNQYE